MFKLAEIDAALGGAVGLARGDASAISRFPNSEPAFWRSFAAIFIIAPVDLLHTALRAGDELTAGVLLANTITVALQWVTFPLLMVLVARILGLGARYGRFVIAYNWSSLLVLAALLPSAVLSSVLPQAGPILTLVAIASIGFVLWFSAFLTRAAFETTWANATGIVVLDILTGMLIARLVFLISGVPLIPA